MKIYSLEIFEFYGDTYNHLFAHPTNKTQEEFKTDCLYIIETCQNQLFKDYEGEVIGTGSLYHSCIANLHKMGYEEVEVETFRFADVYKIDKTDNFGIMLMLDKKLVNKICEHNEKTDSEI